LNDAFENLRADIRELRTDMRTMRSELHADIQRIWVAMIGGYTTIVMGLLGIIVTQL
jgi:hypothetical protein